MFKKLTLLSIVLLCAGQQAGAAGRQRKSDVLVTIENKAKWHLGKIYVSVNDGEAIGFRDKAEFTLKSDGANIVHVYQKELYKAQERDTYTVTHLCPDLENAKHILKVTKDGLVHVVKNKPQGMKQRGSWDPRQNMWIAEKHVRAKR